MALIEHRLDSGELSPFPLLRCRNVYVLPGIPTLLQKKWKVKFGSVSRAHARCLSDTPLGPSSNAFLMYQVGQIALAMLLGNRAHADRINTALYQH